MFAPRSILLRRRQGIYGVDNLAPVTVVTFQEADAVLALWAETVPEGARHECAVTITFENGRTLHESYRLSSITEAAPDLGHALLVRFLRRAGRLPGETLSDDETEYYDMLVRTYRFGYDQHEVAALYRSMPTIEQLPTLDM